MTGWEIYGLVAAVGMLACGALFALWVAKH
jgi:hypothetical protein